MGCLPPFNLLWDGVCQLTTFVKGIYPPKLWWNIVGFVWCVCRWLGAGCVNRKHSPPFSFLSLCPSLVSANVYHLWFKSTFPSALMAEWLTGRWQETNVCLHHTGHPHKHSATLGPCSELLICWRWGGQSVYFREGRGPPCDSVTKSAPASIYKVINSVCFSLLPLLLERMDSLLCSTTLISPWAVGTVDSRGKMISSAWRNGSPLGGFDWLPLGKDLLQGVCWYTRPWRCWKDIRCVCWRRGLTNGQHKQRWDV